MIYDDKKDVWPEEKEKMRKLRGEILDELEKKIENIISEPIVPRVTTSRIFREIFLYGPWI